MTLNSQQFSEIVAANTPPFWLDFLSAAQLEEFARAVVSEILDKDGMKASES